MCVNRGVCFRCANWLCVCLRCVLIGVCVCVCFRCGGIKETRGLIDPLAVPLETTLVREEPCSILVVTPVLHYDSNECGP